MIYDYQGFPEETYHIVYRGPGDPALAERIRVMLDSAGIPAQLDLLRRFDHATFSPMKPLYPEENLPVVQIFLDVGMDPEFHFRMGCALAPLRKEGVLIIGSGLGFHNLRAMNTPEGFSASRQFDAWLRHVRRFAGSCRFVFNKAPNLQKKRYEAGESRLGYAGLCKRLTEWRNSTEAAWLADAPGRNVRAKSGLNKSIHDQGWFEFRRQLDYKLAWNSGHLIAVLPRNTSRT